MIYFDNAATTFPKPRSVSRSVMKCINEYCGNPGRASHALALESARAVYDCRSLLSGFLGVGASENIVFTPNTTYALNIALFSMIPYGSHVITSNIEHNSVLRPLAELKKRRSVSISAFDSFRSVDDIISQISGLITPKTKAVVISHSSNVISLTQPIARIGKLCSDKGIYLILDCAQSAGVYDINMKRDGVSAICVPSHKGLYGIQGAGACCFSSDIDIKRLQPVVFGGNGVESKSDTMPEFLPEKFEAGTLCVPAIASLCEGIRFIESVGISAISEHHRSLSSLLIEGLSNMSHISLYSNEPGCNVLFNVDGMNCEECAELLDGQGFCVRAGLHCAPEIHRHLGTYDTGAVRVSFGYFNTPKQVHSLIKALDNASHEKN